MSSVPPNIAETTGPLLLGYLLNYGLFGVLSVQTYLYYTAFPRDKQGFQTLVYVIYLIEAAQTVMITHDAFKNFAYGFGTVDSLNQINIIWFDVCILDGLVAFLVQCYFSYRIYLLSRFKVLVALILFTAFAQFAGAIATGVIAEEVGVFSRLRAACFIPACFWLGGSALCDIIIALSMTYVLSRMNGGFQETRDLVKRIIRLTMETGSLTAAIALVDLILFLVFPNDDFHIVPALTLAKLYSNSLLVVFNSRLRIPHARGNDSESAPSASGGHVTFRPAHNSVLPPPRSELRTENRTSVWHDHVQLDTLQKPTPDTDADISDDTESRIYDVKPDLSHQGHAV
ncbi:hypothetical protein Moror_2924 [Moniliophthora roreri MCA 2997]|uniref:DUF6534 domain-containing protein n=1 Tax=Moniliophthora roreri (strain MCA 2997) TaxID=1381753 RepID=V2YHP5_MONRO|nr:hypothetical protein Moror_2924 [Moniliophthora roreri MCA 2997]